MSDLSSGTDCAICGRELGVGWPQFDNHCDCGVVCRSCEEHYSKGKASPKNGAFRDRRIATQIAALSNAIETEALHAQWRQKRYG